MGMDVWVKGCFYRCMETHPTASNGTSVFSQMLEPIFTGVKTPHNFRCNTPDPMEATMTNRTIKHEVKLQKSVIIILGILAVGVFANAFAPTFSIKDAQARMQLGDFGTMRIVPLYVKCVDGCLTPLE